MNGYESYFSSFPPEPKHTRVVVYPTFEQPLNAWLRAHGVLIETQRIEAKLLSAADGATTYRMENGGIAEVMPDKYSGAEVILIIPPDQVQVYHRYRAPLPFWAWSTG